MARKLSTRARGAVLALIAALTGGGTAVGIAAASAAQLPNLNAASLANIRIDENPALSAAVSRVLASSDSTRLPYYAFTSLFYRGS